MFTLIKELETIHEKDCKRLVEAEEDEALPAEANENATYGIYTIPFARWEEFTYALDKVNKKAEKYGVPPLSIKNKEKVKIEDDRSPFQKYAWKIQLEGEPVRIKGWEFVASLEHGANGNVIRFVPGKDDLRVKDYAQASNRNCDFCHSSRDRLNTYIVRNTDTNELKQVGGQCLQKYIGDNARKLAKFAFSMSSIIDELMDGDGERFGGGGRPEPHDARTALATAFVVIERHGYTSNAKAEQYNLLPTMSYIRCALYGSCPSKPGEEYETTIKAARHPDEKYFKQADELIAWFNNLPQEKKETPYMVSIGSIIDADMVSPRSMGLIVSLPATYHRYLHGEKQKAEEKPSAHVGTVGSKIAPTEVKCVYAQYFDGNYGRYQICKFVDDSGNVYTWFNTSSNELEAGASYKIVGTVKKHDEYQGKKQTTLTRVKATAVVSASTENGNSSTDRTDTGDVKNTNPVGADQNQVLATQSTDSPTP